MKIESLELTNYRNYETAKINFGSKINVFIGKNASGKTNILESIYILALARSYRTKENQNLINQDKDNSIIKAHIKHSKRYKIDEHKIIFSKKGKVVMFNKKPFKKISDYISKFNVIIFQPEDFYLIKGSPKEKRKYFNLEIGQINNRYLFDLGEYNNLIKTKNEYLKTIDFNNYDKNYIETINYQLAKRAKNIYLERKKFLNKINEKITKINEKLKTFQNIKITMTSAIEIETEEEKIEEKLYLKYNNALFKEIQMNQTLFGPHRDDFIFIVNDNDANEFCSQGQQRMAILMLKLSEIEVFKDVTEEYPVLLLDDVFSELDQEKKKKIINYLYKRMQIIITTTDLNNLDVDVLSKADIFVVKNKKIKKQNRKTEV